MTIKDDLFEVGGAPANAGKVPQADPAARPAASPRTPAARRSASPRAERGDGSDYTAEHIEVLEGLEPVRRRPGMYIGGTDEKRPAPSLRRSHRQLDGRGGGRPCQLHRGGIWSADGSLTSSVTDNGRGIPVDPHPKFPGKSALEVIMTTLHAGGKFDSKVYETSGGLHGVGVSVVNALSDSSKSRSPAASKLYRQRVLARPRAGRPLVERRRRAEPARHQGALHPDAGDLRQGRMPNSTRRRLFKMARSKAYLFGGVEIRWRCDPAVA